jgi:sialate O-acetylesterase
MKIDGDKIEVSFDNAKSGLLSKSNPLTKDVKDGQVEGFEIAGDDGKFIPADAKIDGDKVIVSSSDVSSPKNVRYAWQNAPKCSLYNKEGLPAVPFKTDKN